jgi:hypothetical protein
MLSGLVALVLISIAAAAGYAEDPEMGTVYVVVAVDTEPMYENPAEYSSNFDLSNFDTTGENAFVHQIMNDSFRSEHEDTYGGNIKFTFFVETSTAICSRVDLNCGAVFEALEKFRKPMSSYGDELGWHNHHVAWLEANFDPGEYYWSQIVTFDGTKYRDGTDIESAEKMLNCLLVDHGYFPAAFRAGWLWENTDYSNWLDDIVPFDFSNLSPVRMGVPVTATVFWGHFDWSRAPVGWTYYNPSRGDYQTPGGCKRTIFRCDCDGMFQSHLRTAFEEAATTGDDIYVCAYTHASASIVEFLEQQRFDLLSAYSGQFDVPFRYTTAIEAARIMLGLESDTIPPVLAIEKQDSVLRITSDEDIFQEIPYCVMESGDNCERVKPTPVAHNIWEFQVPSCSNYRFAVGVCDHAGNAATARYVSESGLK